MCTGYAGRHNYECTCKSLLFLSGGITLVQKIPSPDEEGNIAENGRS